MKKIIPILLIGILTIQAISVIAVEKDEYFNAEIKKQYNLEEINICQAYDEYISVKLSDATSYILDTADPMLPKISKVFTLPFGSYVNNVEVIYKNTETRQINGVIQPAPKPVIDGSSENPLVNIVTPFTFFSWIWARVCGTYLYGTAIIA